MMDLLIQLKETEYWPAIRQFNRLKDEWALNSLGSIDPFKEPTSLARTQGVRIGLFFLEKEVNQEFEERSKKAEANTVEE